MIKKVLSRTFFILILMACMATWAGAQQLSYYVGPEDILEISVWRDESLSREVVVPPDGIITFPLIGDINVNNMNVTELRKKVTQRLSEYIPDATVTVMIKEINSLKAYVIGKVNNPGEFSISMDTSVMQILSKAGGLNPYASDSKIHILRLSKGKTINIPFDYSQVVKGRKLEQNIILIRGDVVVVP